MSGPVYCEQIQVVGGCSCGPAACGSWGGEGGVCQGPIRTATINSAAWAIGKHLVTTVRHGNENIISTRL